MGNLPIIPGYKIEKLLGEGGMASVYMGIEESLGRKVAVKILDKKLLRDPKILERFEQESRTAANLYHSNIISVFKIGTLPDGDHPYIVMEFLEETLKDHMLGFPEFFIPAQKALDIVLPIMGALEYAHKQGIVHRDIKTDNIMFRQDGTPVLVDFGIARVQDSNALTRDGTSLGTPYYMSPEQCQALPLDGRSDVYGLGVVLFEIITGRKPYDGDTPVAVAIKHIQEPVPQLPQELRRYQPLIDRMMAKNKDDRISTEMDLIMLVDSLSTPGKVPPPPAAKQPAAPAPPPQPSPANPPQAKPAPPQASPQAPPQTLPLQVQAPPPPTSAKTSVVDSAAVKPTAASTPGNVRKPFSDSTQVMDAAPPVPPPGDYLDKTLYPTGIQVEKKQAPKKGFDFGALMTMFKAHPHRKKIEFGLLGVAVIVIFIIFYNLGSGSSDEKPDPGRGKPLVTKDGPGVKTPPLTKPKTLTPSQAALRDRVTGLINNGSLADLESARQLLNQAKEKNRQGFEGFDELVTQVDEKLEEQKDQEYAAYFDKAQEYFKKEKYREAFVNLERAEKIKPTPELKAFKQRLMQRSRRSGVKLHKPKTAGAPTAKQDNAAFQSALKANSVEALQEYVDKYPSGRYVDKAVEKMTELREMERIKKQGSTDIKKEPFRLRSKYTTFSYHDIEAILKKRGFFDDTFNQAGNFENEIEAKKVNGKPVVVDEATGLMWYNGPSSKETTYYKATRWVRDLNRSRYGGFGDWRLPTVEEAASLLEKKKNESGLHIHPAFSSTIKRIWTGDKLREQTHWLVRFEKGIVYGASDRSLHHVRPVRYFR